jgi:hypothetical protein
MYLDIAGDEDGLEATIATFRETGPSRPIAAVELVIDGRPTWCRVRGWERGPATAWVTPIEESGDGPAQLVHGGSGGIRLQALATEPVSAQELDWSAETRSWAEPFLVITPMARCR